MKTHTPAVYKDFEIKQVTGYEVFGKQFTNEWSAKRFGSNELLRLVLHETGLPTSACEDPIEPSAKTKTADNARDGIDVSGADLREWLITNVHTLLPVLNTLAEHHPKQTACEGQAVED